MGHSVKLFHELEDAVEFVVLLFKVKVHHPGNVFQSLL